jgi:hypothetical protein
MGDWTKQTWFGMILISATKTTMRSPTEVVSNQHAW